MFFQLSSILFVGHFVTAPSTKSTMDELYQIRKNYGIYMGKKMER